MHRKAINRTPVASNCLLPTLRWHGRHDFSNAMHNPNHIRNPMQTRPAAAQIASGPGIDLLWTTFGINHYRIWYYVVYLEQKRRAGRRTRASRNQQWVFWKWKSSETITASPGINAESWRWMRKNDGSLAMVWAVPTFTVECGRGPCVLCAGRTRDDSCPYEIQWTARRLLV